MRGGFRRRMTSGEEEEFDLTQLDRRALGFIWKYVRPYLSTLLLCTGAMMLVTATTLASPYLLKIAIDDFILPKDLAGLNWILVALLACYGVNWLASYWQTYLSRWMGQSIVSDVRVALYEHLQKLPIDFFKRQQTGDVMARVTHDVNALANLVTSGFVHLLNDLFTLIGIAAIMLLMNWRLALISFTTIPIIVLVMRILGKKMRTAYHDVRENLAELNADVEENISGIRVVQALNREAINTGEFSRLSWQNLKANLRAVSVFALLFPTMTLSRVMGEALVISYGGWGVVQGTISLGVVMAFLGYVRRFFAPLADLSQVYNTLQSAGASLDRIMEYMFMEPSIVEPEEPETPSEGFAGEIAFEDVTFAYEDTPVVQDLTLKIASGEVFALVGPTGAGKTTVVNLLARLYDADAGSVHIDGVDVTDLAFADLRKTISVVPQDVFLFDTTIRENIRYGRPEATDEEVEQAARSVHAHDFIADMPNGYDTQIGEGGGRLSGGQRQLVSFARALLVDPQILILDEATSSVDAYTEMLIRKAMKKLMEDRTVLLIAHRFATLQRANRIGVMSNGVLQDVGTHEGLMQSSDLYRDLVQKQNVVA